MASPTSPTPAVLSFVLSLFLTPSLPSSLIQELNTPPPPEFPSVISNNCARDPSLRYCNSAATDLANIYKSTVVARHLCAESRNPDCNLSFARVDLRSRPKVAPLYLSFAFFWFYCPSSILAIDLANNSLHGAFPAGVLQCAQVRSLDLSLNALQGDAPLDGLANLTNLSFLNLSYNRFSECGVERVELFKRFKSSSFIHSGLLPGDHHHGFEITATILLLLGVLVTALSVFGLIFWLILRRRRGKLTTAMLKKATNGFAEYNLVRKAEREDVYIGKLRGVEVEVHVQRGMVSKDSRRAFGEECRILLQLKHNNLVKVIGWCDQRELRAVVMERIHVCSVEGWLIDSPPWTRRLKVLVGVIDGVCYLEENWPHVGYDVRTRCILLTEDVKPLISKFRIGKQDTESKKQASNMLEDILISALTSWQISLDDIVSEVYRIGLFLLELVANKRPREVFEAGESGLIEWVKMHHSSQMKKVIDEKMKLTATSYEQIKQITAIALESTNASAEGLPTINQVTRHLRKVCASSVAQTVHRHRQARHKQTISGSQTERAKHHQ